MDQAQPRVDLREVNRRFYDALWSAGYLVSPHRFNTWRELSVLAATASARLEVGPGLRPRLPVSGTHFVDVSEPAVTRLRERGGRATLSDVTALPFRDRSFDLVCAFDIVEHVEDDRRVFAELSRVARPGASVVLSVPLHRARWTVLPPPWRRDCRCPWGRPTRLRKLRRQSSAAAVASFFSTTSSKSHATRTLPLAAG